MPAYNAGRLLLQHSLHIILCTIQLFFTCFLRIAGLILRLYPGNWFNDFRNIEVGLEELSEAKKEAVKPVELKGNRSTAFLANTPLPSAN